MIDKDAIRMRWEADGSKRDERGQRLFAASEARAVGWGGVTAVAEVTGVSRKRIAAGQKELDARPLDRGRVRRRGGGRRPVTASDSTLLSDLERLVAPATMGDPMRPLLWVSKSREKLSVELAACGHDVSPNTVGRLLVEELAYSRQNNRKTCEGRSHPDRDAQFEHINSQVKSAQAAGQPVISVDTKKKELIGNFRNAGTDYRPKGDPLGVNVHDFMDKELGKVVPHGVYDPTANVGWVSVGINHDTAEFAVQSIRTWIARMGQQRYPDMRELTITADCGGSNNVRARLWKVELQKLADEMQMPIKVCHYPPGTSKWNKIEHRLFCHITQNWRARPLTTRAAVVELIGATTTKTGLKVECALDTRIYEKGIKVSDAEMVALDIRGDTFHPQWNYTIHPRPRPAKL